jgi:integrase
MAANLTELQVKGAKPQAKKYVMSAGRSVVLVVMPDGAKYWRWRYRVAGKARSISLGSPYPKTTLKGAHAKADEFRALRDDGVDPAEKRKMEKQTNKEQMANTFGQAAEAWFSFHNEWSERTAGLARMYLDNDLLPNLKTRPIDHITAIELGAVMAKIEARGAFDAARKVRGWLRAIFEYARAKGWTKVDPARDLDAVAQCAPAKRKHAHLQLDEFPDFLAKLDAYSGSVIVKSCTRLSIWTANRPGITRTLRWSEVNLSKGVWVIERGRDEMKRGYFHVTPLPTQAMGMLREIHKITGNHTHVFFGHHDHSLPLSDGAVAGLIGRIGYRHKQTPHGFRHVISTALNEWKKAKGYDSDWIERQLAHGDPDEVRDIYNEAMYLEPRRMMMQDWADYVDQQTALGICARLPRQFTLPDDFAKRILRRENLLAS